MEKPKHSRKTVFLVSAVALVLALTIGVCGYMAWREADTLSGPTGVDIGELTPQKEETLYKTCLVWGLAKYCHPAVVGGGLDWDKALIDRLPALLETATPEEADALLAAWLEELGPVEPGPPPEIPEGAEALTLCDFGWLEDPALFSAGLRSELTALRETNLTDRAKSYTATAIGKNGIPYFSAEKPCPGMIFGDDGYRLVALFRFWNVIAYYFPYQEGMVDMETLFFDSLRELSDATDRYAYEIAVRHMVAALEDSHAANLFGASSVLNQELGSSFAPLRYLTLGGRVMVTEVVAGYEDRCGVQPGDVVLSVEGEPIEDRLERCMELISCSSPDALIQPLRGYLLAGQGDTLHLEVEREGQWLSVETATTEDLREVAYPPLPGGGYRVLEGNIGYVNAGSLTEEDVKKIPAALQDTKGVIFDLRRYPSAMLMYGLISSWLKAEATTFALLDIPWPERPGEYLRVPIASGGEALPEGVEHYRGKVVVLVNDNSISQAEFAAMALRSVPGAVVIGVPTVGADGNVVELPMPGEISFWYSSLGVYTRSGEPTQRVGVRPDVLCVPTPEGLRDGRDEQLEMAVELIGQKK